MHRQIKQILLLSLFCIGLWGGNTVFASDSIYVYEYFQYTTEDASVTILSYYGTDSEVTVPSMIAGNPVNTIASGSFSSNDSVMKIHLPDTVMTVEEAAFSESQTVVFNSNTDEATEWQPESSAVAEEGSVETQEGSLEDLVEAQSDSEEAETETSGTSIVFASLCIVVFLVVVLCFVLYRKKRKKKNGK